MAKKNNPRDAAAAAPSTAPQEQQRRRITVSGGGAVLEIPGLFIGHGGAVELEQRDDGLWAIVAEDVQAALVSAADDEADSAVAVDASSDDSEASASAETGEQEPVVESPDEPVAAASVSSAGEGEQAAKQ